MTENNEPWIIIVGAGPSGLLLGLLLAKAGIPVQLIDQASELDRQPRATHYGPPAVYELGRAGVLEDARAAGFDPDGTSWRKLDGTEIAHIDNAVCPNLAERILCLPLDQLGAILLRHLVQQATARISWDHKVVNLGQDENEAWVEVDTTAGKQRLSAKYIVGCDGGNSQVRKSLFGDWEFPGCTWEEQIVATNTYYDFSQFGWCDANFIVDPEHWYMAARISNDGLWRVTYGEVPGLTRDELLARREQKFKAMLPGAPGPEAYRVANFSPYKIHQRLAESMRIGRFLLAADAAHLCNPFGGLGLTGGIVDVGNLYDCLYGIFTGRTSDSILSKYSEVRRQKYQELVDPISSDNIRRLFDQDPEKAHENDEFFRMCRAAAEDRRLGIRIMDGANALKHDFTQYYGPVSNGQK